jgi:putative redox protein
MEAQTSGLNQTEDAGRWVTARIGSAGYRTEVSTRTHNLIADEPTSVVGGTDDGPTPYEFLLTAISSCTVMTLRFYADRKKWPLEEVSVSLRSGRSYAADCADCEKEKVGITRVERRIEMSGALTDEQRTKLLEIADRCPVKQSLAHGLIVETVA